MTALRPAGRSAPFRRRPRPGRSEVDCRRGAARRQGLLAALAPLAVLAVLMVDAPETFLGRGQELTRASAIVAGVVGLALVAGGVLQRLAPRVAAMLSAAGLVGVVAAMVPGLLADPAIVLVTIVVATGVAVALYGPWPTLLPEPGGGDDRVAETAAAAAVWASAPVALAVWALVVAERAATGWLAQVLALVCFALSLGFGVRWAVAAWPGAGWKLRLAGVAPVAAVLAAALAWPGRDPALTWLALAQGVLVVLVESRERRLARIVAPVLERPPAVLVGSFALLGLAGTLVLTFPAAAAGPVPVGALDALFTAFSATCVTGLIVLDTPGAFSVFGQATILVLIQAGGLGIMTFSTAAFLALGRRISLRAEVTAGRLLGQEMRGEVRGAIRRVLVLALTAEAVGAGLLFPAFLLHGDGPVRALWRAVFTSVSAFCNAGFALQSDSLVPYQRDPLVLGVVGALIVVGGLGTAVIVALPAIVRRRRPVPLQARLVLWTSAVLLALPAVLILGLEWNASLDGLSWSGRAMNAAFQSITLRTAGFNSVTMDGLTPATVTVMELMMFVGGSPGSTAGGIKTTTFALLVLAVAASLRGRNVVVVFGREVPHGTIFKAAVIATGGLATLLAGFVALQVTQAIPTDALLFETVSAMGTVGLSRGATGELDGIGKMIIVACMFLGRVGPLTLFMLLVDHPRRSGWRYPAEGVAVG